MEHRTTVGLFDSGVGGITVLADCMRKLPSADFLFYADSDHVPYGTKSREEVTEYSMCAVRYLAGLGADAVVVACNTATSMAIRDLRAAFSFPIVGMEPAVKPAAEEHPDGKILVCATPLTIGGEKLHTLIRRSFHGTSAPDLLALPELVKLAEAERFDEENVLSALASAAGDGNGYEAVVLGCTHFLYFRDSFRRFFPGAELVDGNEGTVNRLADLVRVEPTEGKGKVRFFTSGREALPGSPEEARYLRFLARAFAMTE